MLSKAVSDKARCKHCIYFDDGACRFKSPAVTLVVSLQGSGPVALWPPVRGDIDWCSEIAITGEALEQLSREVGEVGEVSDVGQPPSN